MLEVIYFNEFGSDTIIENSILRLTAILEGKRYYAGDTVEWDLTSEEDVEDEIQGTLHKLGKDSKGIGSYLRALKDKLADKPFSARKLVMYAAVAAVAGSQIDLDGVNRSLGNYINKDAVSNNIHLGQTELEDIEVDAELESAGSFEDFLEDIAFSESSGDWEKVQFRKVAGKRKAVYIGKYQFGKIAFKDIGLDMDMDDFAKDSNEWPEDEQEIAMQQLLNNNWHYLRRYHKYEGDIIDGVKLTKSGMLAGSHLVGNGAVKKFIESKGKKNKTDANGVSVKDYIVKFANYDID